MNDTGVTPDPRGAQVQYLAQAAMLTATAAELEFRADDTDDLEAKNRLLNRRGRVLADARHCLKMAEAHGQAAQTGALLDLVDVAREVRNVLVTLTAPPIIDARAAEEVAHLLGDGHADAQIRCGVRAVLGDQGAEGGHQ